LGVAQTTVPALKCLRKLGRMVQVGMPAGDHTTMPIPMDAVYSGQLAVFGTRGMPSWRYPPLLDFVMSGRVDLTPSQATEELAVFDGPAPPGVAVITDFAG
jgi:alcohol dehydrogenase